MVHRSVIEAKMTTLGITISRWFRAELKELEHILMDDENIVALVPGRYFGGYALLIATDHRVLLIDKRTFYLTLEDIRYDMISEVDFSARLFDATLQIYTVNKQHRFTTSKHRKHLRTLTVYIQQQIMQLRQSSVPRIFNSNPAARIAPIKEVYPTRAVTLTNPPAMIKFAPSARNFDKFGNLAIRSAHRFSPHAHLPHPHMPHLPQAPDTKISPLYLP